MWLQPAVKTEYIKGVCEWPDHITPERVAHYEEYGYVVYHEHVDRTTARILSRTALENFWKAAINEKLPKKMQNKTTKITPKKLKVLWSEKARKAKGLDPDDNPGRGYLSPMSGKCIGSYLPAVQREFTMTIMTFETISSLYGTKAIAQIFGPDSYSIKHKHIGCESARLDANFIFDEILMIPERVMASLVTMIDERRLEQPFINHGIPNIKETGTLEVIPGFHHYRRHAARFFHPDTGEKPLDVGRGSPMWLPDNFDAALISFNVLLKELHRHRDACWAAPSRPKGHPIDPTAVSYVDLHKYLPMRFIELKWMPVKAGVGDLICWNQWLPYRTLNCLSKTPRIAFDVSYFKIPPWYRNSPIHVMVKEALSVGDVFEKTAHGAQVRDNRIEREILQRGPEDEMFYQPPGTNKLYRIFSDFIQCIRM